MGAIVIKLDTKSSKLLQKLAKKLGGTVFSINDQQFEDFYLGTMMDKAKTGETVSREEIMKKLEAK